MQLLCMGSPKTNGSAFPELHSLKGKVAPNIQILVLIYYDQTLDIVLLLLFSINHVQVY